MPDTIVDSSVAVVEILIPGPQGPAGDGTNGGELAGYPVRVDEPQAGDALVFEDDGWIARPVVADGDMRKADYDADADGVIDRASVAAVAETAPWSGIIGAPLVYAPAPHAHPIDEIADLPDALAVLAPLASPLLTGVPIAPTAESGTATQQIATTEFVANAVAAVEHGDGGAVTWAGIADKPAVFPPDVHQHGVEDVSGLAQALSEKADSTAIPATPGAVGAAPAVHEHAMADVEGLALALAMLAPLASPELAGVPTAPTAAQGTASQQVATTAFVANELAAIEPVPPVMWADVQERPSSFPPDEHVHDIADVTGLSAVLAGKAALADVPSAPADIGAAAAVHGHAADDIAGLSDALAGKADAAGIPEPLAEGALLVGVNDTDYVTAKGLVQAQKWVTLPDGAVLTPDLAQGLNFRAVISQDAVLAAPLNMQDGASFLIRIANTGERVLTLAAVYEPFSGTAAELRSAAGAMNTVSCIYDAAAAKVFYAWA